MLAELDSSTGRLAPAGSHEEVSPIRRERLSFETAETVLQLQEQFRTSLGARGAALELLPHLRSENSGQAFDHLVVFRDSLRRSLDILIEADVDCLELEFRFAQTNRQFSLIKRKEGAASGSEVQNFDVRRFWAVTDCGSRLLDELVLRCATDPSLVDAAQQRTHKRLEESLQVRRAIAQLRLTVEAAASVEDRHDRNLRMVATAIAHFLGGSAHRQIRYLDRRILYAFQRRVRDCLRDPSERYVRALVTDALSVVTLLSEVRFREELLARDGRFLARLPEVLPEDQSAEFKAHLKELFGVSSILDRSLAEEVDLCPATYEQFLAEARSVSRPAFEDPSL